MKSQMPIPSPPGEVGRAGKTFPNPFAFIDNESSSQRVGTCPDRPAKNREKTCSDTFSRKSGNRLQALILVHGSEGRWECMDQEGD
jgi:hypothetical protein